VVKFAYIKEDVSTATEINLPLRPFD